FAAWRIEHKCGDFLCQPQCARMANADAQAPEVRAGKDGLDIAKTVMARMPAPLLELDLPRQEIEFVVYDQHLLGCQLIKAHECARCLTGAIHEGNGFGKRHGFTRVARLCNPGRKCFFERKSSTQVVCEMVGQPETGVVPRSFVLLAWITKTNDQA